MSEEDQCKEIVDACTIIIESGRLNKEEKIFMQECIKNKRPDLYLQNNMENSVCKSIFIKLAQLHDENEKLKQ